MKEGRPLSVLKKRFANGEISKEEYEESKKILKSN
ncbi:SHOCT domain-containing protein [Muricauda sp. MAR_2010_75]|nr:SHOCT domain-containing protein [Muricauda sp. MAR_2010_75]